MERTIITYRGRKLFTLGHTGTFVNYILIFLFGCGWLGFAVYSSLNEDMVGVVSILGYCLGMVIIITSLWAMCVNRKEVWDNKQKAKEIEILKSILYAAKSQPVKSSKENHLLKQDSVENIYIINSTVWEILMEILISSKYFQNKQIELVKLIYDGLGIDSYYFELDNKLVTDKFFRGQEVITIKDSYMIRAHTVLIVLKKEYRPSFLTNTEDHYLCEVKFTGKHILIGENDIINYT
jgi:NADH:ubiquinone oxidoreductase subunit 6 (subunit J)